MILTSTYGKGTETRREGWQDEKGWKLYRENEEPNDTKERDRGGIEKKNT